jgi:hypothetical protein
VYIYPQELEKCTKEITLKELSETLSSTIKEDETNKQILFLTTVLNYTWEDQQTIAFNAPSSTGKTYIAKKIVEYFPVEDVQYLAYTSPKAFYHELSQLTDMQGNPIATRDQYVHEGIEKWVKENPKPKKGEGVKEWRENVRLERGKLKHEWDSIEKVYRINLERKIIVFLDMPHDELLKNLRSLISHDRKILPVKITDKTREGGNRTKNIWLIGYPTVIFLSASFSLKEQERTRVWLLSPEMKQEKLRKSLQL